MRANVLRSLAAMLVVLAVSFQTTHAAAQTRVGDDVDTTAAGVAGLGLLGAEVGLFLPPLFKLHDHIWAWVLFPALGAGGGVGAGIAVLDDDSQAVNIALISAGMGLAVPAIVGALTVKSWRRRQSMENTNPAAAVRFGSVQLEAPRVSTAPVYTAAEQTRWGAPQRSALRVSLFSGRF